MICNSCVKDKKIHARRKEKMKAEGRPQKATHIMPRTIMFMRPEQIIANWDGILRAVGL